MNKLIIAGLFAVTGLAGIAAAAPASAAPLTGGSIPYCTSNAQIDANAAAVAQQLRGYGYDVSHVEEWNGCVRAEVAAPNGTKHVAYFDPDTLELITTSGAIIGNAQG